MTQRATPPFRADHVGSLLRPDNLHAARADHQAGRITGAQLQEVEDAAVRDAVALQASAGLKSATDGEFRREQWHSDFMYSIPGIRKGALAPAMPVYRKDEQISWAPNATEVTGKLHLDQPIFGDHFRFLKQAAGPGITPKLTVPSPSMVHFRADLSKGPYTDPAEFRHDVAAVYAAQVAKIYELGCRYLQFDDTIFAFMNDPGWRERAGVDAEHQHEINVGVINDALSDKPADLALTVHMCRGNYQSAWFSSGGYDYVAEAVFGGLKVDGLFLEYDDERSGSFEPLRFVPEDQNVVLGLVTTKTPELESKDTLKRRIDEASKYVDLDRLCLSGQCGFASTVEGNTLTIDQEKAKLELIVETAQEVWG
ncbi:MAG: 5-methyltetrahydropteroyltriglutamate--homocysteine S-methyltransferase [Streptosporangiales bacterium]|nr:5-methyltetrahydropteroyltriglutamate--homocysteine S-methyltransferase [Streptosporangiales bacterium]